MSVTDTTEAVNAAVACKEKLDDTYKGDIAILQEVIGTFQRSFADMVSVVDSGEHTLDEATGFMSDIEQFANELTETLGNRGLQTGDASMVATDAAECVSRINEIRPLAQKIAERIKQANSLLDEALEAIQETMGAADSAAEDAKGVSERVGVLQD